MFSAATVKKVLQINDTSKDVVLDTLILSVSDFIRIYCKDTFETIPAGLLLPFSQMIGHILNTKFMSGTSSESLGDHSISTSADFPPAMLKMLSPYRKVKCF
jgi:hypothetical protein